MARRVTPLDPDLQAVFCNSNRTQTQQPIRQAEKAGVVIRRGEGWQDLRSFFGLHLQTRRDMEPPAPLCFFQLLWECLIIQGMGFVFLAYQAEQLLSGVVFLHWNKMLTYKYSALGPTIGS